MNSAQQLTNFALLNYAERNRFDELMSLVFPYHYWYTRSGLNWARRMMQDPARLALYIRYKRLMNQINEERGLRQRFEGRWKIPTPQGLLPTWMDQALYVDPTSILFPMSAFDRADWENEEQANDLLTRLYQGARQFGFRPYAPVELGLQLTGALGESKENIGSFLPQTGVIRGASAMLEAGPAGGYNIEAPVRRALGLGEQEPWDPYRVQRMLSSMAADDPNLALVALRAQELQQRAAKGDVDLRVATGEEGAATTPLRAIQQGYGWTDDQLQEAQAMLRTAVQRAGVERGVSALASFAGVPASVVTTGEQQQLQLQREGQAQVWSPENPQGSRAAYEAWRAGHPEQYARSMGYQVLPGETESQWWTPGTAANVVAARQEREASGAQYEQQIDAAIRADPTDTYTVQQIDDQARAARDEIAGRYPVAENEEPVPVAKYGQTPEELGRAILEAKLYEINKTLPKYADFESGAEYSEARDKALAALATTVPELVTAQRAGATRARTLREALEGWLRRYDTPLQALQSTYFDEVYWPAVDAGKKDQVKPMDGQELIDLVLQRNPDRGWTREQLAAEYQGVRFPAGPEAGRGTQSPESRAFWDALQMVPYDDAVRSTGAVALVLDKESRGTATAEQVAAAAAKLEEWKAEHPEAEQAYAEAQELAAERDRRYPGIRDLESAYFEVPKAERSAFMDAHPELGEWWDFKDAWKAEHPVYTSLYDPEFDASKAKGYGRRKAEYTREPAPSPAAQAPKAAKAWNPGRPWWEKYRKSSGGRSYGGGRRYSSYSSGGYGDNWWRPRGFSRDVIYAGL
jgi:hypothetical protein